LTPTKFPRASFMRKISLIVKNFGFVSMESYETGMAFSSV
jgi:hypothetical protein